MIGLIREMRLLRPDQAAVCATVQTAGHPSPALCSRAAEIGRVAALERAEPLDPDDLPPREPRRPGLTKDGALVANANKAWNEVDAALPAQDILAFIPGTKHGTREVFEEKVILAGCEEAGAMEALVAAKGDEDKAHDACMALRTDGKSVDIDGDYTETLSRIDSNKAGIGVFGLAFYENNTDKLKVATMSGVVPSTDSIAKGEYPVSRPLYFYIKKAHIGVIPGLKEFAEFFVSDDMAAQGGDLLVQSALMVTEGAGQRIFGNDTPAHFVRDDNNRCRAGGKGGQQKRGLGFEVVIGQQVV